MSTRYLVVRVGVATAGLIVAACWFVVSLQGLIQTGRPASPSGAGVILSGFIIVGLGLYAAHRIRSYLDATRPPVDAVTCGSCGNHASVFDHRCRRCGARVKPRA
jgi:hypothetical protein